MLTATDKKILMLVFMLVLVVAAVGGPEGVIHLVTGIR
jgi:hypothetical protein